MKNEGTDELVEYIMEAIQKKQFSMIPSYDDIENIYFRKESVLHKYIIEKLNIDNEYDKRNLDVVLDSFLNNLKIYVGLTIDLRQIKNIAWDMYMTNAAIYFRGIELNVNLEKYEDDLRNELNEYDPSPFIYTTESKFKKIWATDRMKTIKVKKFEWETETDKMTMWFDTELGPENCFTHHFIPKRTDNDSDMKIEAITDIGEMTEIYKTTIQNFSTYYDVPYLYLIKNGENCVITNRYRLDNYAFEFNSDEKETMFNKKPKKYYMVLKHL